MRDNITRPYLLENLTLNQIWLGTFPYHPERPFADEHAILVFRIGLMRLLLAGAAAAEQSLTDELVVETVQAFGLHRGVVHVEGKCTSRGPRIIEVNARMGGGRIHQIVEAVWGVDLIEEHLRSCLDLPAVVRSSRRPRCGVVDAIVYAPSPGRLVGHRFGNPDPRDCLALEIDTHVEIGDEVVGPESVFATALAEVMLTAADLRRARALAEQVLREPPEIASVDTSA